MRAVPVSVEVFIAGCELEKTECAGQLGAGGVGAFTFSGLPAGSYEPFFDGVQVVLRLRGYGSLTEPEQEAARGAVDQWQNQFDTLILGASLVYRHPIGRVVPYVGAGPRLVVFDAQDRASTAYVRRSLLEVLVGDHVEMRPGADAPSVKQGG